MRQRQHILAICLLLFFPGAQLAPTTNPTTAPKTTTYSPSLAPFNTTTCTCLSVSDNNGQYDLNPAIDLSCQTGYVQIGSLSIYSVNSSSCQSSGLYPLSSQISTRFSNQCSSESECILNHFLSDDIYSPDYGVGSCFLITQSWSCSPHSTTYSTTPSSSNEGSNNIIYYIEAGLVIVIIICIFSMNQKRLRRTMTARIIKIRRKYGNDRWYSRMLSKFQEMLQVPAAELSEDVVPDHRPRASLPEILPNTSYLNVVRARNSRVSEQTRTRQRNRGSLPHIFSDNLAWGYHRRVNHLPTVLTSSSTTDPRNDPAVLPEASLQLANIPYEQMWMSEEPPPNYEKAFESSIDPQLPPNYTSTVANNRKLIRSLFSSRSPTNRVHPFIEANHAMTQPRPQLGRFTFNVHQVDDDIILGNYQTADYLNIFGSDNTTSFGGSTTSFTSYSSE